MSLQIPSEPPPPKKILSPRKKAEIALSNLLVPFDVLGKAIMGDLWKTLYESVQDAIALSLLLHIPSLIGKWILGKEFSGFDACMFENPFGIDRYACFIIVASDFCLWIVLAGRVICRFLSDLNKLLLKMGVSRENNP